MRWLLFVVIVLLTYLFIKKLLRDYQLGRQIKKADPKRMVRCRYCQIFLPENEALSEKGDSFCCREHRELAKRGNMRD